ncbi:MAG: S8 family serine peptidase [Promethearchaeota archaeon]
MVSYGNICRDIYSTKYNDDYQYKYGTSMAAPHVAGVAALARGKCPPITYYQLKSRILDKVDVLSSLNNKCVSNGRVNAYGVIYDPYPPSPAPDNISAVPNAWDLIEINWQDNSCNEIGFVIERREEGKADPKGDSSPSNEKKVYVPQYEIGVGLNKNRI